MARYFKVNIRRLPYSLVWSWGSMASFAAFVVRKALQSPAYGNTLVPEHPTIVPVDETSADPELRSAMRPSTDQIASFGFAPVLLYSSPTLGPSRGLAQLSLSDDRRATCLVVAGTSKGFSQVVVSLLSVLGTGRMVGTSTGVVRLSEVPGIEVFRMPGADAGMAATSHMQRIHHSDAKPLTHQEAIGLVRDQQERALRYYVSERIYVEATQEDITQARAGCGAR